MGAAGRVGGGGEAEVKTKPDFFPVLQGRRGAGSGAAVFAAAPSPFSGKTETQYQFCPRAPALQCVFVCVWGGGPGGSNGMGHLKLSQHSERYWLRCTPASHRYIYTTGYRAPALGAGCCGGPQSETKADARLRKQKLSQCVAEVPGKWELHGKVEHPSSGFVGSVVKNPRKTAFLRQKKGGNTKNARNIEFCGGGAKNNRKSCFRCPT